jgi:hypothetical protein
MTFSRVTSGFGWIAGALAVLTLWPLIKLLHDRNEVPLGIVLPLVVGVIGAGVGSVLAYVYRKARFKQQRLNRTALAAYELVEEELQALLVQIRNLALEDEQRHEFEEAQGYWERFRDAQAFDAAEVKGGTLWPLLFFTTMEELTRERLESLRKSYNYLAEYHIPPPGEALGQKRGEILRRHLDGHWEYACRVTSSTSFEDNTWGRGGIMTISVSLPWTGVTARIMAERLWATTSRQDTPGDRIPLVRPIRWYADGAVILHDERLSFEYFSGDGRGMTKDRFHLQEKDNALVVAVGTFKHQRADGQIVEGTVQLRKMRHYADFEWAPSGIKPPGAVVQSPDATHGG